MKGEFFRPCPKCGKICNANLDMCEICSGKIAKPEQPKPVAPIVPVVEPVFEPVMEEVVPVPVEETTIEEVVTEETAVEEITTEAIIEETVAEEVIEENITEENKEEKYAPITENAETPKAVKNNNRKGLYALIAVLMLVIVALVVVIVQDRQPIVAVGNTTLPSNTTSTTLVQETEITTEITTGTTTENAGETLAPVTTTKKAQNTNKETTTKKNTSSTTKETTTKKITTTTTEASEVEFNPTIVYSKDEVYRVFLTTRNDGAYFADVKVENVRVVMNEKCSLHITIKIMKLYEILDNYGNVQEISGIEFSTIKDTEVTTSNFILYAYNENGELYSKERLWLGCTNGKNFRPGNSFTDSTGISDDEIDNVTKYELICEEG